MILPGDKNDSYASAPESWWNHGLTFHVVLLQYNIQRPFLIDCLWGFFSLNVILLQTSVWKCHPTTLVISSPALFTIIHHFPLEGSHSQGEALFELYVLRCDCKSEGTVVLDRPGARVLWFDVCSAVLTCYWRSSAASHAALLQRSGGPCKLSIQSVEEEESCNFGVFAWLTSMASWHLKSA